MSLSKPTNPPLVSEAVSKSYLTRVLETASDENQTKVNQLHGNTAAGSTGAGIPKQVFGVMASVAPSSSGMTSVVTITFQRDPSDRAFTGVVIFAKGYQGNQNPVQIANSATSPVQFTVNNTGENLSLSVQAIGNAGRAPISSLPITSVKLPFSVLGGAGAVTQTSATALAQMSGTLDNIQDGTSYAKPIVSRISSGKPLIDFSESIHLNKNIDNVADGVSYARPIASRISSGKPLIDFSESINLNKNVDNVADGTTYARPLASRISSGKPLIDFSESIHLNKNVDNVADGTTYARPLATRISSGKPLIDFSESIHLNKNVDNVGDGSTYGRTLLTALTSGAIDPTKSGVLMKGSVAPFLTSGFIYTSTTTTITISWLANQTVYRADGTKTQIGAGSQTITGLLANNTYYFYPYYDEVAGSLKFLQASDITIPTITGVLLNGSTQWIQTATAGTHPDPGASGVYSLEFWIKTTTTTSEGILSFSAPQGSGTETAQVVQVAIGGALGEITFAYVNASAAIKSVTTSGASANDGAWHHVVISFASGGTVTIYVDGTSRGTGSALGAQGAAGANSWWHIGFAHGTTGWPVTTSTFLNGSISHVAIYNTALSANQVAAHVQSAVNLGSSTYDTAVTNDSPSFYWKLIETSGTSAADSAGSNTGTYQNSPTLNQTSSAITVLGTPQIAWPFTSFLASQGQNAQNRVPLSSGSLSAATPASGTGGGTGGGSTGGGSRGGCFSGNTRVVTARGVIPIEEVRQVEDWVLTAKGWAQVKQLWCHDNSDADTYEPGTSEIVQRRGKNGSWLCYDMGDGEMVTVNHSILSGGKWCRAYEVFANKPVIQHCGPVFNLTINAEDEDVFSPTTVNSFTLANGLIVHNVLPK